MAFPMHVHGDVDVIVLHGALSRVLTAQHKGQCPAVIRPVGVPRFHAMSGNIGEAAAHIIHIAEMCATAQNRVSFTESDEVFKEMKDVAVAVV